MFEGITSVDASVHCPRCDKPLDEGAIYCSKCGQLQVDSERVERPELQQDSVPSKARMIAAGVALAICGLSLIAVFVFASRSLINEPVGHPEFEITSSNFDTACGYVDCEITASLVNKAAKFRGAYAGSHLQPLLSRQTMASPFPATPLTP
jgi:predicted nucleic acid-binding Zn ribbon protein